MGVVWVYVSPCACVHVFICCAYINNVDVIEAYCYGADKGSD